ncbi:peptidylprolyl isomerase [Clostridium rectalis]|uniref:peptidylprolyl isomerase n=1 Tax=Clostridium rectalis TaxID=2040295 RepID=UPI000F644D1D|nr:peptidylprolyl isomerase [Clostridium rectalis]
MKNIKKLVASTLISILAMSAVGCSMIEKTPEAINKSVVAKVGNEKITRGELDTNPMLTEQISKIKQQYGENYDKNTEVKDQLLQYKKQVLDQMITEKILLSKAKELKVDESKINEELTKTIDNIIKQNFNGDKAKYSEEIKKMGVDENTLKEFYKTQLIANEVQKTVTKDVKIDDAKALKYYNDNIYSFTEKPSKFHAWHILVKTEEEAKKVKERLNKGEDFAKVAKEVSTDPGSKESGGDLGSVEYSQFVKPFSDAVVKLNKGEISDPVNSKFGYHIIKVIDKDPVSFKKFDTVKEQIKKDTLAEEQQKVFTEKVNQWKKDTKIETEKYEKNIL